MTHADKFRERMAQHFYTLQRAGLHDVARGVRLAMDDALIFIEELQAAAPKPKQRRPMNLSPEERQRRADRLLAYHAKRRENRA